MTETCSRCGIALAPINADDDTDYGDVCVTCLPAAELRRAQVALDMGHVFGVRWAEVCDWLDLAELTDEQRTKARQLSEAFIAAGTPEVGDESVCEALRELKRSPWIRGCVHAAACAVLADSFDVDARRQVEPTRELIDAIEETYKANRAELQPLIGSDRVWQRLADLHRQTATQLDLGGEAHVPDTGADENEPEIWTTAQPRLFEPQMEGQGAFDV